MEFLRTSTFSSDLLLFVPFITKPKSIRRVGGTAESLGELAVTVENMKLPFHAVEVRGGILFAARGASIHSFNLADGSHISCSWKFPAAEVNKTAAPRKEDQLVINVSENSTPAPSQDEQGPPAKRVKLDSGETQADNETPSLRGGGSGGKKNKKQGPKPGSLSQTTERSMVILMTITQDGQHVVAVTSDKSIWVLEHDGQGQLKQLSRRYVDPLEKEKKKTSAQAQEL